MNKSRRSPFAFGMMSTSWESIHTTLLVFRACVTVPGARSLFERDLPAPKEDDTKLESKTGELKERERVTSQAGFSPCTSNIRLMQLPLPAREQRQQLNGGEKPGLGSFFKQPVQQHTKSHRELIEDEIVMRSTRK
ncbi:hypothetical protein NHX12_012133 [Muraenolepis orangiensis]|uniref:Uncharacterized protein n=1 Tax=Muraenolepis orangiensis TaxID=630683 RepID=A0A9Q0DJ53_9TELE|nr:hypothetical protein NHX12_012133 [Muraenolepis orangiensis]